MTLSQRLHAAAEAERLADWVKLTLWPEWVVVTWRNGEDMVSGQRVRVEKPGTGQGDTSGRWVATIEDEPVAWRRTREAAIRAGLLALAKREEKMISKRVWVDWWISQQPKPSPETAEYVRQKMKESANAFYQERFGMNFYE